MVTFFLRRREILSELLWRIVGRFQYSLATVRVRRNRRNLMGTRQNFAFAAETANRGSALSFLLVDLIAHVACHPRQLLFRSMPSSPRVLARRWRLVHKIRRLGSARKATQPEYKATARIVEKWCMRARSTWTVEDTPRAGRPRTMLASREVTRLLMEVVIKRDDQCP
jgi:hypothetical protein